MGNLRTAANGMAWTTASTIIRSLVSMLQVAILTRFLEKSDFGIVAIATLFIGFIQIFLDLGLSVGIMHKQNTTKKEYSSLFWLNIISGLILTALLIMLSPLIASYYDEPVLIRILTVLSFSMFFSSLGSQHRTIQQKLMRFKTISIVEIIASVTTIVVAVVLAIKGWGIYSLVLSTLYNIAVTNVIFLIIGLRLDNNISLHFSIVDTYPYLKIGVFSVGTQILDYLSRELDVIIISSILGKETLGVYSLCKRLILSLYYAVNPILMKVMTPMLATIQEDIIRLKSIYYKIVESLALVNYPIYGAIAIFSSAILNVLYGSDYSESYRILGLLALYYGYLTTGNPVGALQTALGRTDTGFYWTICRIVIYSVSLYVGSSTGNIEIMLIVIVLVNLLVAPIAWRITIKPLIGGAFWEYFKIGFYPLIGILLFSTPFYLILSKQTNLAICLLAGVVYMFIYIVLILRFDRNAFIIKLLLSKISDYSKKTIA